MSNEHKHDHECVCCQGGEEAFLKGTRDNIAEYGVSLLGVGNEYVYSIGAANAGRVDLVLGFVNPLLNNVYQTLGGHPAIEATLRAGKAVKLTKELLGTLVDGYVVPIPEEVAMEFCGAGYRYYSAYPEEKQSPILFAQVFFPDTKGTFPWEVGYVAWGQTSAVSAEYLKDKIHELVETKIH